SSRPSPCWSSTRRTSNGSRAPSTRSWPTSGEQIESGDELGRPLGVPRALVSMPAYPPGRARSVGADLHRGRALHLRRAGRVLEAVDPGRRPLALLLRASGAARLLPPHHAGGGAPSPPPW